jgi:hypothetical protein
MLYFGGKKMNAQAKLVLKPRQLKSIRHFVKIPVLRIGYQQLEKQQKNQ